jgi:hypothetical protein
MCPSLNVVEAGFGASSKHDLCLYRVGLNPALPGLAQAWVGLGLSFSNFPWAFGPILPSLLGP